MRKIFQNEKVETKKNSKLKMTVTVSAKKNLENKVGKNGRKTTTLSPIVGGKIGLWKIKDQVEVESNIEERRITKKRGRTDEIDKNGVPFWGPYSVTDTVTFRGGEHRNFSGGMKKRQNFESKRWFCTKRWKFMFTRRAH